jgi:hypothetical protein
MEILPKAGNNKKVGAVAKPGGIGEGNERGGMKDEVTEKKVS